MAEGGSRLTVLGVLASIALILVLLCVGVGVVLVGTVPGEKGEEIATPAGGREAGAPGSALALVAHESGVPRIDPPSAYTPKDGVVEVEISEYAGYSGLVVANNGLAPNPGSWFTKNGGFQLKLTVSEEDAWSRLNAGKLAATVTTVDVLPLYGRQLQAVVPVQIGFSRGADGIVVRSDVRRLNDLRGKVLVAQQFGESEFFLRYLAQEAGIPVKLADEPVPQGDDAITLVFAEDAFAAGDVFLEDLKSGGNAIAGCVTWDPKTSEVAEASEGKAHVLVTNRNLLVIADVLLVNRGFAEQNPAIVKALVEGLLVGNELVRTEPERHLHMIAKAFGWTPAEAKAELAKVHLSNLPENLAFFGGAIDMAGSFGGIYQSAVLAYGREIVRDVVPPERFADLTHLEALRKEGKFAAQKAAIEPIKVAGGSIESDPLLSKDIRFFFEPNSSRLDMNEKRNLENLKALKQMLAVSPGSTILLRGHVDDARKAEFQKQGGDAFVRQMALKAIELSTDRAKEVEARLVEAEKVDEKRVEAVGVGWDEPVSKTDPDANRRVEAQWFTLE